MPGDGTQNGTPHGPPKPQTVVMKEVEMTKYCSSPKPHQGWHMSFQSFQSGTAEYHSLIFLEGSDILVYNLTSRLIKGPNGTIVHPYSFMFFVL